MVNNQDLLKLRSGPHDLCFDKDEFTKKSFSVDQFLQDHRKRANLETMRDDLGVYLKVLRSSMIELINKDYADFVNLSSNLIGLDKAINGIQVPLGQLKEEVLQVQMSLDEAINDVSECLDQRRQLRMKKYALQCFSSVQKSLDKLHSLLNLQATHSEDKIHMEADLVERAATEYNQLQFNMSKCNSHLLPKHRELSEKIKEILTLNLNKLFLESLKQHNVHAVTRCLSIYVTLNKVSDAEELIKKEIVSPYMHDIICETSLQSDPMGLLGVYNRILSFLDQNLNDLLQLTSHDNSSSAIQGFNFIVNSFWSEVEHRLELHLSSIYAPGNPEVFYQRYSETLEFLSKLDRYCGTKAGVKSLHNHPQYVAFLQRWNLPVYFQIRFQEIAGSLESVLSDKAAAHSLDTSAHLQLLATSTAWDCILRCWENGVFLIQLAHRFWKLSLQIIARYHTWTEEALKQEWNSNLYTNDQKPLSKVQFLVCLYLDIEKLSTQLQGIHTKACNRLPDLSEEIKHMLNNSLDASRNLLTSKLPTVSQYILGEVTSESMTHLRQVSDIPRLYRRTNREVPTVPCSYVQLVLTPPCNFYSEQQKLVDKTLLRKWITLIFSGITQQFYTAVNDVLTSVQKTEESLRRLKKIRDKSSSASNTEGKGFGDDDKIRLQLYLDVKSYLQGILDLEIPKDDVHLLPELLKIVESAQKKT